MPDELSVRKAVRDHYAQLAESGKPSVPCCGPSPATVTDAPQEAARIYDGCGSPVETAEIRSGSVVVDLGSGGGFDVF